TAPALVDLMAGQLQFAFDAVNAALPHIRGGRLRALAITGRERSPLLPDVMTIAESVLPGFEAGTYGVVLGPAGIPGEQVARLNQALTTTLR
ncbi:tripartite tricarboxylate transporter substrate-binding protein, partial [Streptomyces caniscabiei]|uniref:tripartite tricarboxylate transporter substrate-binding protein n=1 Tax=Streptomyces caniscabiei TaxID=2746961 RepID=UPI0038F716C4